MPMIMAEAVMSTGRMRAFPDFHRSPDRVAMDGDPLAGVGHEQDRIGCRRTHRHDRAHQRRHGNIRVGQEQRPCDARQCAGQGRNDDEGIDPGLEIDDDQEIHEHDRGEEAEEHFDEVRRASLRLGL